MREHRRATRSFTNCFINSFSRRCITCAKDFMWKPLCAELPFHGNETRHKHVSKPIFGTLENCCVGFMGIKPGTCVCRLHSQMSFRFRKLHPHRIQRNTASSQQESHTRCTPARDIKIPSSVFKSTCRHFRRKIKVHQIQHEPQQSRCKPSAQIHQTKCWIPHRRCFKSECKSARGQFTSFPGLSTKTATRMPSHGRSVNGGVRSLGRSLVTSSSFCAHLHRLLEN